MGFSILCSLRYTELKMLYQQVKLGGEHLHEYLNPSQYRKLIRFVGLSRRQKATLYPHATEKSSSFWVVINMLFTTIVGTWLGAVGFMGFGVGSARALLITILFSAILSIVIGFYNYQSTKKKITDALEKQVLENFQLIIIKNINRKRKKHLKHILHELTISPEQINYYFKEPDAFLLWLNDFYLYWENLAQQQLHEDAFNIFCQKLHDCTQIIKTLLENTLKNHHANTPPRPAWLAALSDSAAAISEKKPPKYDWIKNNLSTLISYAIPTLFSGLSSTFFYFDGIEKVAKALNIEVLRHFTQHPFVQPTALVIAILITLYFGYSYIMNNYKSYKRDKAAEITMTHIQNEESKLNELNNKMYILRKIKKQAHVLKQVLVCLKMVSKENAAVV